MHLISFALVWAFSSLILPWGWQHWEPNRKDGLSPFNDNGPWFFLVHLNGGQLDHKTTIEIVSVSLLPPFWQQSPLFLWILTSPSKLAICLNKWKVLWRKNTENNFHGNVASSIDNRFLADIYCCYEQLTKLRSHSVSTFVSYLNRSQCLPVHSPVFVHYTYL